MGCENMNLEKQSQEKLKRSIVNDKILLREAASYEKDLSEEQYTNYRKYHSDFAQWYKINECFLDSIVFSQPTLEEMDLLDTGEGIDIKLFEKRLHESDLSFEQIEDIFNLRTSAIYKRVLGLASLQKIDEVLDYLYDYLDLDIELSNEGKKFKYLGREVRAKKLPEEIADDISMIIEKVSLLVEKGKIQDEERKEYEGILYHIYEYYTSISNGEQIQFPKISDTKYDDMKTEARRYNKQMEQLTRDYISSYREEFDTIQSFQRDYYYRNQGNDKPKSYHK